MSIFKKFLFLDRSSGSYTYNHNLLSFNGMMFTLRLHIYYPKRFLTDESNEKMCMYKKLTTNSKTLKVVPYSNISSSHSGSLHSQFGVKIINPLCVESFWALPPQSSLPSKQSIQNSISFSSWFGLSLWPPSWWSRNREARSVQSVPWEFPLSRQLF